MVKRSIEQNLRVKNFEAGNGNYETSAVVKSPGTKHCGQNSWRLLAMGNQRAVSKRRQLQFPSLWIKRSGDGRFTGRIKILRSIECKDFPNFEMLDAKIASALNRIIQNSYFKKKVSLEEQKAQKQDRFLRGSQIAFMIYDYFRVTGAHDTVLDYADSFSVTLQDDNIQESDTRWDEVQSHTAKIPSDDVLDSLYKLKIRESEKLKTVLELYDLEIHQKKLRPDYHRLKTMVKRSIEQDIRNKNFGARNGNYERNAVVKNSGTKQCE